MYKQVEKPKGNKSRAVANSVTQKKSNGKQGFGFVDNRPESIIQTILPASIHRDYHSFSADDKKPKQFMKARLLKDEKRAPTDEEIKAATAAATANSQKLAGHGRQPHGKKGKARPADQQEANAARDIQNAVDRTIQL